MIAHYKDVTQGKLYVHPVQPHRDATDEKRQDSSAHGGWKNVFEYLRQDDLVVGALSANSYLVIHVDGDICFDSSVSIDPRCECQDLVEKIRDLAVANISPEIYGYISERLIFAIPLHSTECWLIPIHSADSIYCRKKNGCIDHLRHVIRDKDLSCEKNYENYKKLTQPIKKAKHLENVARYSNSFAIFRDSLPILQKKNPTGS